MAEGAGVHQRVEGMCDGCRVRLASSVVFEGYRMCAIGHEQPVALVQTMLAITVQGPPTLANQLQYPEHL